MHFDLTKKKKTNEIIIAFRYFFKICLFIKIYLFIYYFKIKILKKLVYNQIN